MSVTIVSSKVTQYFALLSFLALSISSHHSHHKAFKNIASHHALSLCWKLFKHISGIRSMAYPSLLRCIHRSYGVSSTLLAYPSPFWRIHRSFGVSSTRFPNPLRLSRKTRFKMQLGPTTIFSIHLNLYYKTCS